eukprot:GEMP01009728.1.p1 GENE.GEMP01009728.1~~GEMP01009728.1.p1  ORF type:complete len:471 (+),score=85.56 GEMP01009728.1:685-2097(+)
MAYLLNSSNVMAVLASFAATVGFALISSTKLARQARRESTSPAVTPELSFSSIAKLPRVCWYLYLQIGCLYAAIFPFEAFGVPLLDETYHISESRATLLLSIVPSISLLAPLIATFFRSVDNRATLFGKKLFILNVGWACIILTFVIMCFPELNVPFLWMTLLGTGYALNATVCWIMVPDIVKSDLERLSVAMCYVALGVAMFVSNLMTGILRDHLNNAAVLIWFMTLGTVGITCAYAIRVSFVPEAQLQENEDENEGDDVDLLECSMGSSLDRIPSREEAGSAPLANPNDAIHAASSASTKQEAVSSTGENADNLGTDDTPGVNASSSSLKERAPNSAVDAPPRIQSKCSHKAKKADAVAGNEDTHGADSRNTSQTSSSSHAKVVSPTVPNAKDTRGTDAGGRNKMNSSHTESEAEPAALRAHPQHAEATPMDATISGASAPRAAGTHEAATPVEKMTSIVDGGQKEDK